jgi:hypothetical protein
MIIFRSCSFGVHVGLENQVSGEKQDPKWNLEEISAEETRQRNFNLIDRTQYFSSK